MTMSEINSPILGRSHFRVMRLSHVPLEMRHIDGGEEAVRHQASNWQFVPMTPPLMPLQGFASRAFHRAEVAREYRQIHSRRFRRFRRRLLRHAYRLIVLAKHVSFEMVDFDRAEFASFFGAFVRQLVSMDGP